MACRFVFSKCSVPMLQWGTVGKIKWELPQNSTQRISGASELGKQPFTHPVLNGLRMGIQKWRTCTSIWCTLYLVHHKWRWNWIGSVLSNSLFDINQTHTSVSCKHALQNLILLQEISHFPPLWHFFLSLEITLVAWRQIPMSGNHSTGVIFKREVHEFFPWNRVIPGFRDKRGQDQQNHSHHILKSHHIPFSPHKVSAGANLGSPIAALGAFPWGWGCKFPFPLETSSSYS